MKWQAQSYGQVIVQFDEKEEQQVSNFEIEGYS
jgi:hypothetical protein